MYPTINKSTFADISNFIHSYKPLSIFGSAFRCPASSKMAKREQMQAQLLSSFTLLLTPELNPTLNLYLTLLLYIDIIFLHILLTS
ncbi:hypothetical protein PRUPE_7G060600 [Prunus persica]|uniref:Uncharacterized protein n=1 Tax=Prunus persica TaxID=3760 RepID=A0A251N7G6_PRUPE|nr:hypothetical protein PRUPE_7G060600 [Prunus persica]